MVGLVILAGVIFLGIWAVKKSANAPGRYDALATALTQSGAKFYGAFWCPHCQQQKTWFGKSAKLLPYVECSNPDHTQIKICADAGIKGYPTWIFADGTTQSGEIRPADLAKKIGFDLSK